MNKRERQQHRLYMRKYMSDPENNKRVNARRRKLFKNLSPEKRKKLREYTRKWSAENREKIRQYYRKNIKENPNFNKKFYAKNKKKLLARTKMYRESTEKFLLVLFKREFFHSQEYKDSVKILRLEKERLRKKKLKEKYYDSEAYLLFLFEKVYYKSEEYQKDLAEDTRQRAKEWARNNSDWVKKRFKLWMKKNHGKLIANGAKRRAVEYNACPSWVDRKHLENIYCEAKRLTDETGIKMHVDHIWPLRPRSKKFVGLHVPWNLQIIPASENCRKSDKVPV